MDTEVVASDPPILDRTWGSFFESFALSFRKIVKKLVNYSRAGVGN